ncbi:MAG: type IV pilus secretin PilQ [Nitrospinaceae bacterium]|jgi:type IV pilus assembly protein PilQ|nr:type IV pilus secretin PilQ [Nitrospinaceae bacterium]MBT6345845.1 type IV pilus secretin PilQ [Nitrospina sp.]
MKKQIFIKSRLIKIVSLLIFLMGWPGVVAHSSVLLPDRQMNAPLVKGLANSIHNHKKLGLILAQNKSMDSQKEPLGEVVFLNTQEEGQNSIISLESTQSVQYTAFKLQNPLRLVLDLPKMNQGKLTSRVQVGKGIVRSILPIHFKEAGVLRLEITLNQAADYEINKPEKNKLVIRLNSSGQIPEEKTAQLSSATESRVKKNVDTESSQNESTVVEDSAKTSNDSCYPMLYGEKETISLDFQNADVRNLFRVFSEISGFNVILSPEVGGSVNIRMLDVPWNEAMEIILTNSALGRQCFGNNIVRIVTKAALEAEERALIAKKSRIVADKLAEQNAQDLVTEVVRIDNADIAALATNLTALKSPRADSQITVDVRTNTLILKDLRVRVDDMLKTIAILDVPTPQILIEAKIVDISKSFTQELGIQWGLTGELAGGAVGGSTISASPTSTGGFLVDLAQTSNISSGSVGGFGLALGNLINGLNINLRLEALETQGKGRILSSPKVTTADNKEARIRSGRQIPYQVTSAEGNSIQFVDAELSLTVTPHATSDNKIYLIIDATKNAADFTNQVNGVPTITTKETHTEVLVGNGDTTVLGGIYESESTENKKEVPFLSKVPVFGNLFKSFADADTITELLVFITPTIIETN